MKSKGFTLVELLAVITILGVLALIVTIAVGSTISSSKENLLETQIKRIEKTAEAFYLKEGMDKKTTCVNVSELLQKGYIQGNSVKDPTTNEEIKGSVNITYSSNQYSYTYQIKACPISCDLTKDLSGDKVVSIGDEVTCGTQTFYVLPNDLSAHKTATEENITLLTKHNLDVGSIYNCTDQTLTPIPNPTGIQNPRAIGSTGNSNDLYYGVIAFSEENYWGSAEDGQFIYDDDNLLLYPHVQNYKTYMENIGVDVKEASLASSNQLSVGEFFVTQEINTNFKHTTFWYGTVSISGGVLHGNSWGNNSGNPYYTNNLVGLRPIIVIPASIVVVP